MWQLTLSLPQWGRWRRSRRMRRSPFVYQAPVLLIHRKRSPFPAGEGYLIPRFARINNPSKANAFWNHQHCWWFSFHKKAETLKPSQIKRTAQSNGHVTRGGSPRRVRLLFYLQKRPCQRQAMVSLLITSWRKADTARRRCRLVSPIPRESPIRRCRPRSAPEYGLRSAPWSGGARW